MRRMIVSGVMALALMAAAAGSASAQFAGKWQLSFGEWQTGDGGQVQINGGSAGVLNLSVKGDSISGTFASGEGSAPPLEISGVVKDGTLVLRGSREGRRNINGEEQIVKLNFEFELKRNGDAVTVTQRMGPGDQFQVWRTGKGEAAKS